MNSEDNYWKNRKNVFLLSQQQLIAEAGEHNVPENPPDRKAKPNEVLAAAEISVFLEDDLGVDTKRLFIQVRDGYVYIQGSVETEIQKKEIEIMIPNRTGIKGFEAHITIQKSGKTF